MSTTEYTAPKVLIAGAGIGGLYLAILLDKAGITYEIYERTSKVKPLGEFLELCPLLCPTPLGDSPHSYHP